MTRVVDEPCLVLNRRWQPVAFLSVGVAITSVLREMAWVLHPDTYELLEWEPWCEFAPHAARRVTTPSGSVPAPEVVVLREYEEQPRRGVAMSRKNLFRRDGWACQYCGARPRVEALTIDHVLPRSRGGPTSWENCVAACGPCNRLKADRTPDEAGLRLRVKPRRPAWKPLLTVPERHFRAGWAPFVEGGAVEVVR